MPFLNMLNLAKSFSVVRTSRFSETRAEWFFPNVVNTITNVEIFIFYFRGPAIRGIGKSSELIPSQGLTQVYFFIEMPETPLLYFIFKFSRH